MRFAHDLTRDNMAKYYATRDRVWDTALFNASWPNTENYCLLEDGARIGVLRIAQEEKTLWVRDLQISPARQSRGGGDVRDALRRRYRSRARSRLCSLESFR